MLTTADLMLLSMSALAALAVVGVIWAWSWKGWLDLKRQEIGLDMPLPARQAPQQPSPTAGSRIELADLRERIRKLEAIAAGVDM